MLWFDDHKTVEIDVIIYLLRYHRGPSVLHLHYPTKLYGHSDLRNEKKKEKRNAEQKLLDQLNIKAYVLQWLIYMLIDVSYYNISTKWAY